jgi:polyisoprenoid-binding protein YceI
VFGHCPRSREQIRVTRLILLAATVAFVVAPRPCDAQPRAIDSKRSTLTVRVFKSGLFRAFADDHVIEASLADGSLDDSATPSVRVVIDVHAMKVLDPGLSPKDRQDVQTRMMGPEVLDADRFQHIRFRSVAIEKADGGRWSVRGELEMHGQTQPVSLTVVREQGRYKGSTSLKQSDFGITPISIAGGTVKVKDEIKIDFDIATAAQ